MILVCFIIGFAVLYLLYTAWTVESFTLPLVPQNEDTEPNVAFSNIDVVYYINLDRRPDRKEQVLSEIHKLGLPEEKIVRIKAVDKPDFGALGCSMSHIDCLKRFIASPHTNCIVLEDDFEFVQPVSVLAELFYNFFNSDVSNTFDVCMLSMSPVEIVPSEYSFVDKVKNAHTTSGYMLNKKFAKKLLANFEEGAVHLERTHYDEYHVYAIDQYWKKLQPQSNWYSFNPIMGKQRASYSDIHKVDVDYQV